MIDFRDLSLKLRWCPMNAEEFTRVAKINGVLVRKDRVYGIHLTKREKEGEGERGGR